MGADTFIPFEPGDLTGADMIGFDQRILRNAPYFYHFPQFFIGNHVTFTPSDLLES